MLTGKKALVPEASSDLGYHFAQTLAIKGAMAVFVAYSIDELAILKIDIREKCGSAFAFSFDAVEPDAPEALIEAVSAQCGVPDILINNAGISLPARAREATLDKFEQTMVVNVRAPWRLFQLWAQHWIEADIEGCNVNLSSILSRRVEMGMSLYSMSKAASHHLTGCQALERAKYGIRVNALCPGSIRTSINEAYWDTELGQEEIANPPSPRLGDPSNLDSALLFLVVPRSQFVNSEVLTVDDVQSWAI